ncbi:hypothetical protein PRIPAC_97739 [Pristionchus pacificus]|uniref:Fatty-acid and retinol-binding protein 1 n=1 Tax=Pristionchus pacificus TaxID=54126 RepID=H3F100_PRIPA|nr:hypothetical protein PRIPAC_97424 [Pristionchus pacificus]KAF8356116.1 hypothetical protein PRIPAC_97739 [Pristionchus pacificus]|eukprot:PDM63694.1 hypothetical protein PRIPAC_49667 [Pristionchus pacificus]
MIRSVAVLALVAAVALSAPFNSIDDVPAEYKDLIPAQAKEFLTSLTDEDKKILKEVAMNYKEYKTEEDALNALKEKSPALYEKAQKLGNYLKEKLDALNPEAKKFAEEIFGDARKIQAAVIAGNRPSLDELKAKAVEIVNKFKALSDEAKADIEKQFPITASVVKNEKFQELAKKLLEKQA